MDAESINGSRVRCLPGNYNLHGVKIPLLSSLVWHIETLVLNNETISWIQSIGHITRRVLLSCWNQALLVLTATYNYTYCNNKIYWDVYHEEKAYILTLIRKKPVYGSTAWLHWVVRFRTQHVWNIPKLTCLNRIMVIPTVNDALCANYLKRLLSCILK